MTAPTDKTDEKTRDMLDAATPPTGTPDPLVGGIADGAETGADLTHPYLGYMGANPAAEEGTQALAGEPLAEGAGLAQPADVEAALRSVYDPEIPVNIYDLGLIYRCDVDDKGDADIEMTLTAPACPVAGEMPTQVAEAVADVEGIGVVTVTLTWNPPWRPDMMSEDAKMALDLF